MKICYLSDANSIHTKKICEFFLDKGYEISVISLNDGYIEGVKVYSLKVDVKNSNETLSKIKYIKNIIKIKKIVKEINPDLLHAHYASSYGLLGSLVGYKPYLLSVWGSDIYDFPKISKLHEGIIKFNLKKANLILSTSKAMAEETNKYTDKKILITPFGVDVEKFKPLEGIKSDKEFVIGTVKTLEDNYGIDYLIKAFSIIKKRNKDINLRLKIAGKGSKEEELKNLCKELEIEEFVEFLGFVDSSKVPEIFNSLDIAVFPSLFESFGVAAVEAQACGIPVVISNVDGLKEATSPNVTSLISERMDEVDLAFKIEELVLNEELRTKMKNECRKFVLKNYNIKDNFNYINKIYLDILNKR